MGIFNRFPYTDFHRLNADWILEKVKEMLGLTQQAAEDAQEAAEAAQEAATTAEGLSDRVSALEAEDPVLYTAQTKTTEQKAQARTNIGAADASTVSTLNTDAVRYTAQSKTTEQKAQARTNIGAASASDVSTLQTNVAGKVDKNAGKAKDLIIQTTLDGNSGVCLKQGVTGVGTTQRDLELHDYILEPLDTLVRVKVANPYENSHAATKYYVDNAVGNAVMVNTVKLNEEETGYESQYTYAEIFAKLNANKPVLFCLEHEDYEGVKLTGIAFQSPNSVMSFVYFPSDPNSAFENTGFRVLITDEDEVFVNAFSSRSLPVPQIGDEGKSLVVGNNMRPAWSESGPMMVDVSGSGSGASTTTTFAQLVAAINAGRQIIVRHTRGTTHPVVLYLTNYMVAKHLNTSTGNYDINDISFRYFYQDAISAGSAEVVETDIITWYSNGTFEANFDEM